MEIVPLGERRVEVTIVGRLDTQAVDLIKRGSSPR
jgi:hypothetical protein